MSAADHTGPVTKFGSVEVRTNDEGVETIYVGQLGDAETNVDDLHVSNDSIWLGDDHKVQITGAGKFKFRKRVKNSVPPVITSGGGDSAGALSHSGEASLAALSKRQWRRYARSLGGGLASAKNKDIWRDNTADYDAEEDVTFGSIDVNGGAIDDTTIGATTASTGAFTTLGTTGLFSPSSLSTSSADINGGAIDGTPIGATTASTGAFSTLGTTGLATLSSLSTSSADINGGAIDGTPIGATTASTGAFSTLTATGEITAYYSDRRLKDVSGPITNALDKVDQLTGYHYKSNEIANKLGHTNTEPQIGLMAQDVNVVFPEAVTLAPIDINTDGSSKSGENYLTIKYEKLIPVLVNAIKELRQEVNTLKALV
jgi:hypothetical protein